MSNILLGISGSVSACLDQKLAIALIKQGHNVKVIYTENGTKLFSNDSNNDEFFKKNSGTYEDVDEMNYWNTKGQVLHIDLVKWADVLCIAPASANTIGKISNGICDNLLTCCYCAFPQEKRKNKKIVIAPAMNTEMLNSPAVIRNLEQLQKDNCVIIETAYKTLACGDTGYGALADIGNIVTACDDSKFGFHFIPEDPNHPGSFGMHRKNHIHTGVDLYCHYENKPVFPFEDGEIIDMGQFTGKEIGMPWWNTTYYVSVKSGEFVTVYGEIKVECSKIGEHLWGGGILYPCKYNIGDKVTTKDRLGVVIPVVNKRHPEYENHNTKMLHVERFEADKYKIGFHQPWDEGNPQPEGLLNPTEFLKKFKI